MRDRPSKRNAFCSASSEDAVTRTAFNGLAITGGIPAMLKSAGLDDDTPSSESTVLLWGVPIGGPDATAVRAVVAASDQLREMRMSRSEPGVVVVTETRVMFIEAETHSTNQRDPDAAGWSLYLGHESRFTASVQEVKNAG